MVYFSTTERPNLFQLPGVECDPTKRAAKANIFLHLRTDELNRYPHLHSAVPTLHKLPPDLLQPRAAVRVRPALLERERTALPAIPVAHLRGPKVLRVRHLLLPYRRRELFHHRRRAGEFRVQGHEFLPRRPERHARELAVLHRLRVRRGDVCDGLPEVFQRPARRV